MRTKIKIEEKAFNSEQFEALVTINDSAVFQIFFENPIDTIIEQRFSWYFEEFMKEPYVPDAFVTTCKTELFSYGENLFKQIFKNNSSLWSYYSSIFPDNNYNNAHIEIRGESSKFQSILWEALKDPDCNVPMVLNGVSISRIVNIDKSFLDNSTQPFINLLIVTARPNETNDINYRTVQRLLVDIIMKLNLRIKPYILRPGTYQSMVNHLNNTPKGFYHIVHFDLHGGLLNYSEIQKGFESKNNQNPCFQRTGLPEIEGYKNERGFVFFETEDTGVATPVDAKELASLLVDKQIPVCILNACQSAKDDNRISLGYSMAKGGMPLVLAMRYTVHVKTVELFMRKFYESLFSNTDIETAILNGRKEIYNNKTRYAEYGYTIELEDWILPIIYKTKEVNFNVRELTSVETKELLQRDILNKEYIRPKYGFCGRDLEILRIEKLLIKHKTVLLRGTRGVGKTTLLKHFVWWWQITGFVNKAFYFTYNNNLSEFLCNFAEKAFQGDIYNNFLKANIKEQKLIVIDYLNINKTILIFDNFLNTKTNNNLTSDNGNLNDFISEITGDVYFLYSTYNDEKWLQRLNFKDVIHNLKGFDNNTTYEYIRVVLNSKNISLDSLILSDYHFQRLLRVLAGNPIMLEAVFKDFKNVSYRALLEDFYLGKLNLTFENESGKNINIVDYIDISYNTLSKDVQEFLLCLTPFDNHINVHRSFIGIYLDSLQQSKYFDEFIFNKFESIYTECLSRGFIETTMELSDILFYCSLNPIFSFYLRNRFIETIYDKYCVVLNKAFIEYYKYMSYHFHDAMHKADAKNENVLWILFEYEYLNILKAIDIFIDNRESILPLFGLLDDYLEKHRNYNERLQVTNIVLKKLELNINNGALAKDFIAIRDTIINLYISIGRHKDAKIELSNNLDFLTKSDFLTKNQDNNFISEALVTIYTKLGGESINLVEYDESIRYFDKATEICKQMNYKSSLASVYMNKGVLYKELKKYEECIDCYKKAITIYRELGEKNNLAFALENLGTIMSEIKLFDDAHDNYIEAKKLYVEVNDRNSEQELYSNMGILFLNKNEYDKSISRLKKAIKIYLLSGNLSNLALTYQALGKNISDSGSPEESIGYFEKAVQIFLELKDDYRVAKNYFNLGTTYDILKYFSQSLYYYKEAIKHIDDKDIYFNAMICQNMSTAYFKLHNYEKSIEYSNKALEIYFAFDDKYKIIEVYINLGKFSIREKKYYDCKEYFKKAFLLLLENLYKDITNKTDHIDSSYKQYYDSVIINILLFSYLSKDNSIYKELSRNIKGMSENEVKDFIISNSLLIRTNVTDDIYKDPKIVEIVDDLGISIDEFKCAIENIRRDNG
ncbi:MAG: tetratricopeptide repeat protein [Nitrospirae bacterium]|nr:tetratricopeptide repeat protein [Nitrospirota bacterium]